MPEEQHVHRKKAEPEAEKAGRTHRKEKDREPDRQTAPPARALAARPTHTSWAEKYRPRNLEEVVGNQKAIADLRQWADDWEHGHPRKKGVILVGAPGTGKTSAAHALAMDMKWGVLELNASDARNYASIKRVAFSGAMHDTFSDDGEYISARTGGRKLIILDEADQLYESTERASDGKDLGDRGGKRAIVETVSRTHQPVLLIVNDAYALTSAGGESLKSLCEIIKFDRVHRNVVRATLRRICDEEGVSSTPEALEELAARSHGDLRAAINDLQSLAQGVASLRLENLKALGERDERAKIFDAMFAILKGSSIERAREAMRRLDEPPDFVLMWLDENLPLEYKDPGDLVRGFDMLSRADMFLGRVTRRQQYGLWAYASDLMSAGVAVAKHRKYHEFTRYRFPMWLVRRSRASGGRRVEKEVLGKIGAYTHISTYVARQQMMPLVRQLFDTDHNFAVKFTRELQLEEEQLALILGVDSASPRVRNLLDAADAAREAGREHGNEEDKAGVAVSLGEFAATEEDEEEKKGRASKARAAEKASRHEAERTSRGPGEKGGRPGRKEVKGDKEDQQGARKGTEGAAGEPGEGKEEDDGAGGEENEEEAGGDGQDAGSDEKAGGKKEGPDRQKKLFEF